MKTHSDDGVHAHVKVQELVLGFIKVVDTQAFLRIKDLLTTCTFNVMVNVWTFDSLSIEILDHHIGKFRMHN